MNIIKNQTPYKGKPYLKFEKMPTESGECGVGLLDATAILNSFKDEHFCGCLLESDIQLANYRSHPTIKAPLSN